MRKTVVIIGAGRSGRGYLARQIEPEQMKMVFLDKNRELIRELREKNSYQIRFWGDERCKIDISAYEAYEIGSKEGVERLIQADYIFICVGEEYLGEVAAYLAEVLKQNQMHRPIIIAAENGTNNLLIMRNYGLETVADLTECLMFCTTELDGKGIDLVSEDVDYLPYRPLKGQVYLPFLHFQLCETYDILVRRKIFTYNSLSACIAYMGALKGYEEYAVAANDSEISRMLDGLEQALNQSICRAYGVDRGEQEQFSKRARKKFANWEIRDTISRNARNVLRKLGPGERIAGPLNLMIAYHIPSDFLEWVAAAAFRYGIQKENLDEDILQDKRKFASLFGWKLELSRQQEGIYESICDIYKHMSDIDKKDK